MTGDSHSNDDSDFLDDDFVVEDIVGKNDDLEDLFDEPAPKPADSEKNATDEASADGSAGEVDEDDLLFTDHTEGVEASEEFKKPTFAEDGTSQWDGEELDLESVGIDESAEGEVAESDMREAEQSFANELGDMLHDEEDFGIESDEDLELVVTDEDVADDGISEFEQSGPFVLDDGDGLWSDEVAASDETEEVVLEDDAEDTFDVAASADDVMSVAAETAEAQPEEVATMDGADEDDFGEMPTVAEFGGLTDAVQELELGDADEPVEAEEQSGFKPMSAADQMMADVAGNDETLVASGPGAFGVTDDADSAVSDDVEEVAGLELLDAAGNKIGDVGGAGWEPLPERSMDGLSEVDEVQRTDDEVEYDTSGYEEDEVYEDEQDEAYEDDAYEEHGDDTALEDVEGHDLYGEESDRAVVLGGPGSQRRSRTLLVSLAASFLLVGGAATIVMRPQWFGLSIEPERVAKVNLTRPKVEVAITEPKAVPVTPVANGNTNPGEVTPNDTGATNPEAGNAETGNPETGNPETGRPEAGSPEAGKPGETTLAKPTGQPASPLEVIAQPVNPQPGQPTPESPTNEAPALPTNPVAGATKPTEVTPVGGGQNPTVPVEEGAPETSWPVAQSTPETKPQPDKPALVPFGDGLLVGANNGMKAARAIDGVMPGSRAFAQLFNGNYFIGKVKQVADQTITLRLDTGEITLATADISQLTRLGSSDYDELQKATKGFVRLTNNNRLIGGIISRIADDHVVLEVRKNRVILPKSAIGEIVSGKEDAKVRLGTTSEEENWVRSLAERQLGTGQGAMPNAKPVATPPAQPTGQPPR